jgi:hypothetical protein
MAYNLVSDYIVEAQALAQDVGPVRYPQQRWLSALNSAMGEAYRLRPDFFRGLSNPPQYEIGNLGDTINWPQQYAWPLLVYIVGHIELTDLQGNEDSRAVALQNAFIAKLTKGKA